MLAKLDAVQHRGFTGPPAAAAFGAAIDASMLDIMRKPLAANDVDASREGPVL